MDVCHVLAFLTIILHCNGISFTDPLAHIQRLAQRRNDRSKIPKIMRRFSVPAEPSVILGAPMYPYHLPPAEPILPGHTLIRPAVGMLKSAVKFPHREHENGSGVYGHFDNLGIKYDGKNDRVLYTGFRRSPQLFHSQVRMNTHTNPYLYTRRHFEMLPPIQKEKVRDDISKELTIFPSEILKMQNLKPQLLKSPKSPQKKSVRFLDETHTEDVVLGQVILIKGVKYRELVDIFRIIKSLRRDQELKEVNTKKLYVPGTAKAGEYGLAEPDPESAVASKTAMFWKTKNAFNHIKISADAPDHTELIPAESADIQRNWWFFHQSDFEN